MRKLSCALIALLLLSCQSETPINRKFASVNAFQPPVEQGEVWGHKEAKNMARVAEIFRQTLIDSTGDDQVMKRDAHPKHHGCVSSKLTIDNSKLPQELRVGLFSKNRSYPGIIRFSNGDPDFKKADIESDVRGMALKLFGTDSGNYLHELGFDDTNDIHDLVMMNADSFFISNPKAYEKFMEATQGRFGILGYLALHWGTLKKVLKARVKVANSLDVDYSSATPYKLGSTSMKFGFKSCRKQKDSLPEAPAHDFLKDRLAKTLAQEEGCFDFYVQPNKDSQKNNIEDAMVSWDEQKSPIINVGKLIVEKQQGFTSESRMRACEDMTFNPWRAPMENRPLGGVNRIRLEVYLNQSKLRHEYNKVP